MAQIVMNNPEENRIIPYCLHFYVISMLFLSLCVTMFLCLYLFMPTFKVQMLFICCVVLCFPKNRNKIW